MPCTMLSEDYNLHRATLKTASFEGLFVSGDIKNLLESDGPNRDCCSQLAYLRDVALKFKEAEKIMSASGIAATGAPTEESVNKAASLKFVRHLYLVGSRGAQGVWVLSTPKAYSKFTSDELLDVKASAVEVKKKLDDVNEQFNDETKKHFGEATLLGLRWCEAAGIALANAASQPEAMAKVKRWFAADDTSDADVNKTIASLQLGFKKVANALNKNLIIITDNPTGRNDAAMNYTEAYVYSISGNAERPRTIYIEKALFDNFDVSVLHDMKKNWARVIVHEATHSEVATKDKGYAWNGIAPGSGAAAKISAADAAINADSWAFFAADSANALDAGEITRALNGAGGTLTKLDKNWN